MTDTPEILIPKRNIVMDSQVLSTLMSCPRLCDFRFNHNFQSIKGKSESLGMGSIVHTFLENYYKNVINGLSKPQAEAFADTAARDYAMSEECNGVAPDSKEWAFETCHQYLEHYKNDFWIPLEVEIVKSQILYEDDEIRILWKAKLDLTMDTTQGIYPVDHKTMKQRRNTLILNNQFMGQCILMGTRLMFVNKIGFQKTLKPADKFVRDPVSYSFDQLHEWQSVILPYYAKFYLAYTESEYWPPNFTHCESKFGPCPFLDVCSVDRGMREETLGQQFVVGEPWDVTNPNEED